MKIIFASKFYYRRGGLESYLFKAKELLESRGHTVIPFSTDYFENYQTEYSKYSCTYYNLSKDSYSKQPFSHSIKATANMFFNREAYDNMRKLIAHTRPDIVQGFGVSKHLSYSIFKAAKESGVKTVMRLSDYALICPCTTAIDGEGQICSDFSCSKNNYTKILKKKCIHESFLASFIGSCEVKVNLSFELYKKYVDYFIAPSLFIRNIFIEHFGISSQRIYYQPIFIDTKNASLSTYDDDFFLYAGRLSKEKGIYTLLKAFSKNKRSKIVIAGTGPEEKNLKEYAQTEDINAEFIGFQDYGSLENIIRRCSAVVIPSEWYENSPNIILEAYVHGKPAIGSNIGGIPELIEDKKTGFLFKMADVDDLAMKIKLISENKSLAAEMGRNAKEIVLEKYSQNEHYDNLINIYKSVRKKKVLLVNNFYYNRGGDCTYLFALKNILQRKGHNVVIFSMHHPQNLHTLWSKYFVNYINYDEEVKQINLRSGIKVASRTIYFLKARSMIKKLIREERPEIAHLQNIHHHITPSILYALKKYNVPIIWTLHDYQLICSNISFLAKGKICERCKKKKYYWPVIIKCKKGSFIASLMSAIEISIHNIMGIGSLVEKFIAPSQFLKSKFIEFGYDANKIVHLAHFTNLDVQQKTGFDGDYYLYVGRISEEKGIMTLIDATVKVFDDSKNSKGKMNICELRIVGGGPYLEQVKKYVKSVEKENSIKLLGHVSHEEALELYRNCKFVVVPSEWYENYPYAIIEAFAFGKPVIGSRIGGIPELVKDNETGLTFEMGNIEDLNSKIEYMINNPDEVERMGNNAKAFIESELNFEKHYNNLMEIYEKAIKKK